MDASTNSTTSFIKEVDAFGQLAAEGVANLVAGASDIAVVLDSDGTVRDLAVSDPDLPREAVEGWLGRPFRDTLAMDSQPKADRLFAEAASGPVTPAIHLNHVREGAEDLPIRYRAAVLSGERMVVVGRDLSSLASAQKRLIAAQRRAEREVENVRSAEARFRQYFRQAEEAALILDGDDRVGEANAAAGARWPQAARLMGRRFVDLLAPADRASVTAALSQVRAQSASIVVPLTEGPLILSPLRHDRSGLIARFGASDAAGTAGAHSVPVARIVEAMPDAFVVTDHNFLIQLANRAFVELTEAVAVDAVVGSPLERWLGRPGVDVSVIRSALTETGILRGFVTLVEGDLGQSVEVELSAARAPARGSHLVGFIMRQARAPEGGIGYQSGERLADLVGRVPIKEIVRETTETIERMCIEAALELSGDNRASAAELLGLSRQSLYVKMRRFGIVDAESTINDADPA